MRSIIQHLRFPFSYLLLPVFLLAILIHPGVEWKFDTILLFFILHILVYPSSNAYNSLQDKDEGSIGLIKNPLPADKKLSWISLFMDISAVLLSVIISKHTALYVLIYILASRLYSYRNIRLKQYPFIGFLIVFVFQGAWIFFLVHHAMGPTYTPGIDTFYIPALVASSCLIGSIYPLSQIYQHDSDIADGVITISYILGKRGTFIFSGLLFLIGSFLLLYTAFRANEINFIYSYLTFQLPSLIYFNYWFFKVIKNEKEANFKHTMRMSLISATCMNAFFIFILIVH